MRPIRPLTLAAPLAAALLAGGCAMHHHPAAPATQGSISGPGYSSETVRYRCEGGTEIEVAYLEFGHGDSFAALHHQGRTALLKSRPSASGVRYIALDEQHSLRWNTKGEEGFLSFLAADHTARERTLLANCRSLPSLNAGQAAS